MTPVKGSLDPKGVGTYGLRTTALLKASALTTELHPPAAVCPVPKGWLSSAAGHSDLGPLVGGSQSALPASAAGYSSVCTTHRFFSLS